VARTRRREARHVRPDPAAARVDAGRHAVRAHRQPARDPSLRVGRDDAPALVPEHPFPVKRAFFARHGESEYSVRELLNGDVAVSVGLTDAGREQARRLGTVLRAEPLDLCVTSTLLRPQLTADLALGEREVPRLAVPELNDPLYGPYEGRGLKEYRAWAGNASSGDVPGDGGESRYSIVERYVLAFRVVLDREEESLLVVAHSLPI